MSSLLVRLLEKSATLMSRSQLFFPECIPLDLRHFPSAVSGFACTSLRNAFGIKLRTLVMSQFYNLSNYNYALYTETIGCRVSVRSAAPPSSWKIVSPKPSDQTVCKTLMLPVLCATWNSRQLRNVFCGYLSLYEELSTYQACRLLVVFHAALFPGSQLRSS